MAPKNRKIEPEEYTYEELLLLSDILEKMWLGRQAREDIGMALFPGLRTYIIIYSNELFSLGYDVFTVRAILFKAIQAGYFPNNGVSLLNECAEYPFNKMPTLINHTLLAYAAVARWRLTVGR
jgi:hypothetical protein